MASVGSRDAFSVSEWPSKGYGYPFKPMQAGRMVYFGRAVSQEGNWGGTAGEPGKLTLTGELQTLGWKVPVQHRPVRLILYHTDTSDQPSAANVNVDYYYRDLGCNQWIWFGGGVASAATYNESFGETFERSDVHYLLTLQGPEGHLIRVVPYYQYLQRDQYGGSRQRPR